MHDLDRVTIGLGGASSWRDRYDGGDESLPLVDFDEIPLDGREVRLCFDSDLHKPMVWAQLTGLAMFLLSKGANVLIEVLPHDMGGTIHAPDRLGIDDLIFRHGPHAFLHIAATARSPFKVDRSGGKNPSVWAFDPEPIESHHKAVMAWAVFKDDYAMRPGFGLYFWCDTHWKASESRGA